MKKQRRHRISVFAQDAQLSSRPIKHHSCKTAERAATLFAGYSAKASSNAWRVIWHRGNLKHRSYCIEADSTKPRVGLVEPVHATPVATRLDELTARHTAFADFHALLMAPGYRPSLNVAVPEIRELADAYDAANAQDGCAREAHRFHYQPVAR